MNHTPVPDIAPGASGDWDVGTPDETGFSTARLDHIDVALTREVTSGRMPGAVVGILRYGKLAYLRAVGWRDPAARIPMTADSLFWIASMTKPISAVAALTLMEHGPLGMTGTRFARHGIDAARWAHPLPPCDERPALPDLSKARFDSGGAGLIGTAEDYLRFVSFLLERRRGRGTAVLAPATVTAMTTDLLDPHADVSRLAQTTLRAQGHGFGLGVAVRRSTGAPSPGSPGDFSWPGAAGTYWWADPRHQPGVVAMTHAPGKQGPAHACTNSPARSSTRHSSRTKTTMSGKHRAARRGSPGAALDMAEYPHIPVAAAGGSLQSLSLADPALRQGWSGRMGGSPSHP